MKIGILTLPFNNNYGGYLQAYALMKVLKDMGHDVEPIYRKHNKRPLSLRIKHFLKTLIKCCIGRKHGRLILDQEKELRERGVNIMPFVDKNIVPRTRPIYSTNELRKKCSNKYDAIIVGSDQVWRAKYVSGIVSNMFLDFTEGCDVKCIAYAASFGSANPEYSEEEKSVCGKLIEKFDAISIREENGLHVFNNFNWKVKTPQVVLDPTLLLCKEDYNELIPSGCKESKGKIFCYVLDKSIEVQNVINDIQKTIGKPICEISNIQKANAFLPPIETWLSYIRDADFVITDSFHGTVFSILFNRPFVVLANKERGIDRFITLLNTCVLSDRMVMTKEEANRIIQKKIEWKEVNEMINEKKTKSIFFIEKSLKTKR